MAQRRRVPATHSFPNVELLEIECIAVSIVRDPRTKRVIGKGRGIMKEVHSVEEFTEYFENILREEKEAQKGTA